MKKKDFGRFGEEKAISFLKRKGIKVTGRNIRTPFGEIDIVGESKGKLYFIEVKTRSNTLLGIPLEAINASKKEHMVSSAMYYMKGREIDFEIGVVSIIFNGGECNIEYTPEIF